MFNPAHLVESVPGILQALTEKMLETYGQETFSNPMHYSCGTAKCNVKSINNKSCALLFRHTPKVK